MINKLELKNIINSGDTFSNLRVVEYLMNFIEDSYYDGSIGLEKGFKDIKDVVEDIRDSRGVIILSKKQSTLLDKLVRTGTVTPHKFLHFMTLPRNTKGEKKNTRNTISTNLNLNKSSKDFQLLDSILISVNNQVKSIPAEYRDSVVVSSLFK